MLEKGRLPWPWGSSEYRELYDSCKKLNDFTEKLSKRLWDDPKQEISEEESKKLKHLVNDLQDHGVIYSEYKDQSFKKRGRSTSKRRLTSFFCQDITRGVVDAYETARRHSRQPMQLVQDELQLVQEAIGGERGPVLHALVAEVLYYNGLMRMDYSKKSHSGVYRAMYPKVIDQQSEKIMQSKAFKKLTDMPDAQLRALAVENGGNALSELFIKELARQGRLEAALDGPKHHGAHKAERQNSEQHGPVPL